MIACVLPSLQHVDGWVHSDQFLHVYDYHKMTSASIMALVHCNGQIITDELHSTIFVSQSTASVEIYQSMPLSILKNFILHFFVLNDDKSYFVDLFYWCPIYMNEIRNSYRCVHIEDDDNTQCVVGFGKKYEPHARFKLMAFIQQHNDLGNQITLSETKF